MSSKQNKLIVLILTCVILFLTNCGYSQREAMLFESSPATIKLLHLPYTSILELGSSSSNHRFKSTVPTPSKRPIDEDYFQIEPSDATDGIKYSQPAVDNHAESSYPASVPSNKFVKNRHLPISSLFPSHSKSKEHTLSSDKVFIATPLEYLKYLDHISKSKSQKPTLPSHKVSIASPIEHYTDLSGDISELKSRTPKPTLPSSEVRKTTSKEYIDFSGNISKSKVNLQKTLNSSEFDKKFKEYSSNAMLLESNNATDTMAHLLPVSSDNILSYENSPSSLDKNGYKYAVPVKKSSERAIEDVPSHLDYSKSIYPDSNHSSLTSTISDIMTLPPLLSTLDNLEIVNQTDSLDNSETTEIPYDVENISSSSISFPSDNDKLSPGTVAGIVIGVLVCTTILSSAVIYLLYQKYNGKCTSVVEGKFNSDNCGYLDDSLRSSIYLNNHIELPKESSEEMSSLDNDSFLNSLETMTIQNYWADNSKNTKV